MAAAAAASAASRPALPVPSLTKPAWRGRDRASAATTRTDSMVEASRAEEETTRLLGSGCNPRLPQVRR